MKALRYHGRGDLRLDTIDEPICGRNQVKVKPQFAGICGTDLTEYLVGPIIIPTSPHPLTGEQIPVVLGHEFSAVVSEIGPDVVGDFQVGDKVALFPLLNDSTCSNCVRSRPNCCASFGSIGFSGSAGGLSHSVVTTAENIFKLPPNVTLKQGALVEPFAVAWHAVTASGLQKGDSALVLGAGPVGLAVVQVLKARGAGKVVVSEVSTRRRQLASAMGADVVLNPSAVDDDAVKRCKEACDGDGPALVFDAAGVQAGLDLALAASRTGATIVNIAIWKMTPQVNCVALVMGEKKYLGVVVYLKEDFDHVIQAMSSGVLKCEPMVTDVVPLANVIEGGFKRLLVSKDEVVKVLVKVQDD